MKWLPGCLDALKRQSTQDFEVIIVDNGSSDKSVSFIRNTYPRVKVIPLSQNFGFSVAVNVGIRNAAGKYIVILNNDTLPEKEWLSNLLIVIEKSPKEVGSLASLMVRMDDPAKTDDAGDFLDWQGFAHKRGHGDSSELWAVNEPVFSACAGAALYRREFFEMTGMFDEKFGSYLEDIDLGLRGNLLGFSCVCVPSAVVHHKSHGSVIPTSAYVYNVTKNRLMVLLKNIPLPHLIRHAPSLLMGQIHSFRVYKQPRSSLKGYWYVVRNLRWILHDRHEILTNIVLSNDEIESLLTPPCMPSGTGRIT